MLQLRSLHHLLVLSRRLNFARAAEELGLSQPALTRSIQSLERQWGMRLFDRDRSGVQLTPQGRAAVDRAAVLLADAQDMERQLTLQADAQAGHVRFGMAPMPARALLPAIINRRMQDAPGATHDVMVRDADALWTLLIQGEIEFFISNEGFQTSGPAPRIETLGHFPIGGIVRADHPLLHGCAPDARFPVIRSSWTGLPLPADIGRRMRGDANVIEDFGSLAAIAIGSDAIWFSSAYAARGELDSGLLREWPGNGHGGTVAVVMCSLERRSQSPWTQSIRQMLRQEIRQLAQRP